jgi:hypothetical protein
MQKLNICITGFLKGEEKEKEKGLKTYLKKWRVKTSKFGQQMIQKPKQNSNRINPKKSMARQIIMKLLKTK